MAAPAMNGYIKSSVDAETQTETPLPQQPRPPLEPSETLRAKMITKAYKPPHKLESPDATHAGPAALLAAQNKKLSPTPWTFEGNKNSNTAATLARAQSKPIEAWKAEPEKMSPAGAAATLAHRATITEKTVVQKEVSPIATSAARTPRQSICIMSCN
jgi:hypothetical protein